MTMENFLKREMYLAEIPMEEFYPIEMGMAQKKLEVAQFNTQESRISDTYVCPVSQTLNMLLINVHNL